MDRFSFIQSVSWSQSIITKQVMINSWLQLPTVWMRVGVTDQHIKSDTASGPGEVV